MNELKDYTTVIRSGMTPAPQGTGRLSPERARDLDSLLRSLQAARAHALVESMSYVVVSR